MLLKDAIMEYLLECKVRRLSQGTIENYDRQLRYHNEDLNTCVFCFFRKMVLPCTLQIDSPPAARHDVNAFISSKKNPL